jgi:ribosomal protein L5
MNNRLNIYFYKTLYWKILIFFYKLKKPELDKIILTFNIRNLNNFEEIVFIKSLIFLEIIANQKAFVKKSEILGLKSRKRTVNFVSQVILRKSKMLIFIDLLNLFIIPKIRKKFIKITSKILFTGNVSLNIKDLTVFPGLFEYGINYLYPLKIDIIFKNSNKLKSKFILKEFGYKL